MTRFSKQTRVFWVEEPVFDDEDTLEIVKVEKSLWIITPHLRQGLNEYEITQQKKEMMNYLLTAMNINKFASWYYTPMFLPATRHMKPIFKVYDCMDELSAFKNAPQALKLLEQEMFDSVDIVFTGGFSLYHAKKNTHYNVHPFPSSIDKHHFEQARTMSEDPADQKDIPHPRFGFYGVLDERFDIELIESVAKTKPEWQFVMLGPVVKIDQESLPKLSNIHYLGGKKYDELPQYLAGWDIALVPFALNESTKYISPTKTPEYLSGGKPVISTPITDVVNPYQKYKLVHIASDADQFIRFATEELEKSDEEHTHWLKRVDAFLAHQSWDKTWQEMVQLMEETYKGEMSDKNVKEKQKKYV